MVSGPALGVSEYKVMVRPIWSKISRDAVFEKLDETGVKRPDAALHMVTIAQTRIGLF